MSIQVRKPGLLTTVQDLGRVGFGQYGVIQSGVMDTYSSRIANLVVGNKEDEAVLEITLIGPSLLFEKAMLIAITGGDLSPTMDGKSVPIGRPVYVKKDSILKFGVCKSGCRAYVAVAGGLEVPQIMNSKSTYLLGAMGGYKGRALQKNDRLTIGNPNALTKRLINRLENQSLPFSTTHWYVPNSLSSMPRVIRIMKGDHFHAFSPTSQERLFTEHFTVTNQSNRMGFRIAGFPLQLQKPLELLSEAVCHGTMQVPPDGNPIILLADRQTTGGYPRIAQVATVDLSALAQVKPGETIYFTNIDLKEAEQLLLKREVHIQQLKCSILMQSRFC